jgi:membrane protease subunit HflK
MSRMKWFAIRPVLQNEDPGSGWGRSGGQTPQSGDGAGGQQPPSQPRPPREPRRDPSNDGPPDLDELWRNFNQKLSGWLGGGRGGSGGGSGGGFGGGDGFKGLGVGAGFIAAVVGLLWLGSGVFIVQEGQAGVVLQFGSHKYTTGPGIQFRLPYPVQAHEIVNISQIRTLEVGYRNTIRAKQPKESLMLTDDENIIDIQVAVQYKLKDASDYLFSNRSPDEAVLQVAETAIREVVGRSKMDDVLYDKREQVGQDIAANIQQILDRYKVGIQISSVSVQNAQPPEQVQAAFDDAVKANQDKERLKSEGDAYYNDVVPKAKGAADRLVEEANGYRERVVVSAEGDASRFKAILVEYNKAPAVTRDRLYLETMQQVMSNVTKVMTDSRQNSQLLYLPLDKLISQTAGADGATRPAAGAASAASAQGSGPAAAASEGATQPAPEPNRNRNTDNRDALRNRDRGAR